AITTSTGGHHRPFGFGKSINWLTLDKTACSLQALAEADEAMVSEPWALRRCASNCTEPHWLSRAETIWMPDSQFTSLLASLSHGGALFSINPSSAGRVEPAETSSQRSAPGGAHHLGQVHCYLS